MSLQKDFRIVSKKLRDSAKGEDCTFNIADVCNYDNETTVLCHLPDESHGGARKSDDISAGFGCSRCHDVLDGRYTYPLSDADREFYMRRAQTRTLRRWIELGLVIIK